MKTAIFFSLAFLLVSTRFCSCQRNRWNGNLNHDVFNRHTNLNVNYRNRHNVQVGHNWANRQTNAGYNYRGNRFNTNIGHNFGSRHTNLNVNYRNRHNFQVGHNWRNRGTYLGYQYKLNFGRRRRSIRATAESEADFKLENNPLASLLKLTTLVEQFSSEHKDAVPEIASLQVSIPANDLTSNVTVAKEIVCLVRKLQKIFPKTLGNFIVKMIKFHGPSFNIDSLGDFYSVDPFPGKDDESYVNVDKEYCEISVELKSAEKLEKVIDSATLLEIKKFVADLILVGMQYQHMLEA